MTRGGILPIRPIENQPKKRHPTALAPTGCHTFFVSTLDCVSTQIFSSKKPPSEAKVFMARIAVVAIVFAGFFVTGDIPSVIRGGQQAVNVIAAWPAQISSWLSATKSPETSSGASRKSAPTPAEPKRQLPDIPASATSSARVSDLASGDRLLIWCGDDSPDSTIELLAVDLIDPARGEALLSRQLDPRALSAELYRPAKRPPLRITLETAVIKRSENVFYRPLNVGPAVRHIAAGDPLQVDKHIGPVLAVWAINRN
jgi:hypothetical protein